MINKIRTRLVLIIISAIIISIISVSLIIHITLSNKFDRYLIEEQEKEFEDIIEIVKQNYKIENKWSEFRILELMNAPLIREYDVSIKDFNNNVIFNSPMENNMYNMHMNMNNKMNSRMSQMMNKRNISEYKRKEFEIVVDNIKVGSIEIGYIGPFMVSEREIDFIKGINTSILYASLISIILAVIIGLYFSSYFSKPIIEITNTANEIRKGKFDKEIVYNSNISEFKDLTNSINHLSYTLNKQNDLRKRLTSDISHELRTPLTILQSHLEAISDGVFEPTKERLEKFSSEVKRLIKLVEELKYLNEIENHSIELNISNVNISNVLFDITETFKHQFDYKNISLKFDIKKDLSIRGDKDKLSQIIINLLSNALKFTKENGEVNINLFEEKNEIVLKIIDNGIGIPKEDIKFIFERLYRTDISRNRKSGGSGIGLTIVKRFVEAHNGSIEVKSEINKGSEFILKFPR